MLTLAVFGQVAGFGFVNFDDTQFVTENSVVRGGLSAASLRWALTARIAGNWIPLTWVSHLLDVQLFGLRAGGHHLVNLLLHLGNALLLARLLAGITGSRAGSLLAALIFAVHPLNVEPVAWVAQRRTLLMTLLGLLAVQAWVRYVRRPAPGPYFLSLLFFALGLLAKPLLVTLPVLLLLLDSWPFRRCASISGPGPAAGLRPIWLLLLEKVPFLALAAVIGSVALRTQVGAMSLLPTIGLGQRAAHSLVSGLWYIGKTVWPSSLAVFYPYPIAGDPVPLVVGAVVALISTTAVVFWLRRRMPGLAVGWAWFIIALLPVIGVLQVGEQAYADRYAYFSLIGPLLALAGTFPVTARWRHSSGPVVAAAIGFVVLAFGAVSFAQARHWRDSRALFTRALEVTSGNYMAHNNLAILLFEAGDSEGATRHFRATVRYAPRTGIARRNLGMVYLRQGNTTAAVEEFRRVVRENPTDALGHRGFGLALEKLGRPLEALEVYREALLCNPGDPETRRLLERMEAGDTRPRMHPPP